jgi:hypothetical protein
VPQVVFVDDANRIREKRAEVVGARQRATG